jgi:hypothetical protein
MKKYAVTDKLVDKNLCPKKDLHQYYSVEVWIDGLDVPYQFKIWQITSGCAWVLAKKNSDIIPLLKVGDTLNIKCYPANQLFPPECLETMIRYVSMNDNGRFKDHCLIGLEFSQNQDRKQPHQPYEARLSQAFT